MEVIPISQKEAYKVNMEGSSVWRVAVYRWSSGLKYDYLKA